MIGLQNLDEVENRFCFSVALKIGPLSRKEMKMTRLWKTHHSAKLASSPILYEKVACL